MPGRPLVQRGAERHHHVGLAAAAARRPGTRTRPRCRPRTARRRTARWPPRTWRAPRRVRSPSSRSAGPAPASTAPRPATIAGRSPRPAARRARRPSPAVRTAPAPAARGQLGRRTPPPARRAAASARPRGAPPRARRTARATSAIAVSGPCTRSATAPTDSTSPAWSILKFERSAAAGVSAARTQQRRPALGRLRQSRDGVGEPRPLVDAARREPAAYPRVAVGHADGPALVARRVERHAGVAQRVGERQVAAAEDAEHDVDAERGQRPAGGLRDHHERATGRSAGRSAR